MRKPDGTDHPTEALSAFLDGELSGPEAVELERHLAECAACTALLGDLRRLSEASRAEELPPMPGDLSGRIMERLEAPPVSRATRPWYRRVPMAAAASLAAVAVLWIVWIRDPSLQTPPPLSDREDLLAEQQRDADAADPQAVRRNVTLQGPAYDAPQAKLSRAARERDKALTEIDVDRLEALGSAGESRQEKKELSVAAEWERQVVAKRAAPVAPRIVAPPTSRAAAEQQRSDRPAVGRPGDVPEEAMANKVADAIVTNKDRSVASLESADTLTVMSEPQPAPAVAYRDRNEGTEQVAFAPAPGKGEADLDTVVAEETSEMSLHRFTPPAGAMADDKSLATAPGVLLLTGESYRVLWGENGALTVISGAYECTLPALESGDLDATQELFRQARLRTDETVTDGRLAGGEEAELDEVAASGDLSGYLLKTDVAFSAADGHAADASDGMLVLQDRSTDGRGVTRGATGDDLSFLRERIESLIRDQYADHMREQCGEPPAPFGRRGD